MIKFRVRSGRWRQIHPGVYATFSGDLTRRTRLWAAVLSAGPGAALSHETAAELHRLADKPAEPIHITVPAAAADGKHSLRYGWPQVKWQPCETAAEVARVLRRRGWSGQPRPCSPGCPVQRDLPG
jgi:hypothetical protein